VLANFDRLPNFMFLFYKKPDVKFFIVLLQAIYEFLQTGKREKKNNLFIQGLGVNLT
jgi:hypothetical protein